MTAKSKFNPALTLGCLTAAVALLAGVQSASAQATAPAAPPLTGAGSFPGSFLVPGTNTSLHVGGIIQFDMYDDLNERDGGDFAGVTSVPVNHNLAGGAAAAENGGTVRGIRLRANSTRPNIETRTPTDYGEVKTYWEIDWQGSQAQPSIASTTAAGVASASAGGNTGSTPCCVEGDLTRLRQAYGTLGPWLFGQTNSNFADVNSYHDVLDGGGQIAEMTPVSVRLVQIRYTQLLPGGMSVSGSIEQPITYGMIGAPAGQAAPSGTTTTFNSYSNPTWSPQRLPAITLTARMDQPWGHLGFHIAAQQLWETNLGSFAGAGNSVTANIPPGGHVSAYGYMAMLTGHINTFGKDKITFNFQEGQGAANYSYDMIVGGSGAFGDGIVCRTNAAAGTGIAQCGEPRLMAGSIGYSHWWTSTWRSGGAVGYAKVERTSAEATMSAATLQNLERTQYQYLLNLQWSPTPQTNFGIEYEWYRRVVQDGAYGTHNRIETQAVFKF